jgi:predicted nucleic acid-binding protein
LFSVEVRHGVLKLERRGNLQVGIADIALANLEHGIQLAPPPDRPALARIAAMAREEALGMYDAVYLDLALERGAMLASRDGPLLAAAQRRSISIVDLR